MKKLITLLLVICCFATIKAQFVTIPDANFRAFLKDNYPNCFNTDDMMDTTCFDVTFFSFIECDSKNIISLEGIQYFKMLVRLSCTNNKITNLPPLANSITHLNCSENLITSITNLPDSLEYFNCSNNKLNSLSSFPNKLFYLECNNNFLTSLPNLPINLNFLVCYENELIALPTLPKNLNEIVCFGNSLTSLPTFPENFYAIDCRANQITSLPSFPNNLHAILCSNNQINSLPNLPNSLENLDCTNNPINCLPILPSNLNLSIRNTNIHCIPNNILNIDSILPLCTNPLDICELNAYTKGIVYNDINVNGIWDTPTEQVLPSQIINVLPNNWHGISDFNGEYFVKLDTNTNNTWNCTVPKYTTVQPTSYSINPKDTLGLIDGDFNFGIHFLPNVKDLEVALSSTVSRPGFKTNIAVSVNNVGSVNQSNITVKLKKPDGYAITATSTPPTSILNDTLIWENISINILQSSSFYVELQVPVDAELGTEQKYETWANGTLGDSTPINNYATWSESVRGSYDPNDKLVSKTTLPPSYDIEKDRLIYTIRFQNTGTDTAFYVRVKDEIPSNLNMATLRVINASHAYQLIVREKNIVEFAFPNILLPDKTTNEAKSHGFVQFSIQPKAGLPINAKIENNAGIYFDYNAPVITNFATTEVKITTGLASNKNLDFKLYPNPTNSTVRVELPYNGDGYWILSDISGRQIQTANIDKNSKTLELYLSDYPSGTYFIRIQMGNQISTAKVMKF